METISLICPRLSPFGSTGLERRIERFDRRWLSSSFLSTPRAWKTRLQRMAWGTHSTRCVPAPACQRGDFLPIYKIWDDEIAPRHSRPQVSLGSDHSRHCDSFPGSPSRVSGQAVWRSTGLIDVP